MASADLNGLIEWPAVECLNQKPGHTIQNALKQVGIVWCIEQRGLLMKPRQCDRRRLARLLGPGWG